MPSVPNTTSTDEPPPNVPSEYQELPGRSIDLLPSAQLSLVPPTDLEDPKPHDTSEAAVASAQDGSFSKVLPSMPNSIARIKLWRLAADG